MQSNMSVDRSLPMLQFRYMSWATTPWFCVRYYTWYMIYEYMIWDIIYDFCEYNIWDCIYEYDMLYKILYVIIYIYIYIYGYWVVYVYYYSDTTIESEDFYDCRE